jgi:hypothetical protein
MFVTGGLDALRAPASKVPTADPIAPRIAEKLPYLPEDTEQLVRINGAVQVAAGADARDRAAAAALRRPCSPAAWCRPPWPGTGSGRRRTRPGGPSSASTSSRTSACSAA